MSLYLRSLHLLSAMLSVLQLQQPAPGSGGRGQSLLFWKDLKCDCLVRSGPVWSVPIEFPRKCISVNPRNCTYAFRRRLLMSSHVGELV